MANAPEQSPATTLPHLAQGLASGCPASLLPQGSVLPQLPYPASTCSPLAALYDALNSRPTHSATFFAFLPVQIGR